MFDIRTVTTDDLDDLETLFCTNDHTTKCWCMWHVIAVKEFHDGGATENRAKFAALAAAEAEPMGLLARRDGEPVGWCAAGPRERFARTLKTPTYRSKDSDPFERVWLVPCFYTHPDVRGQGVTGLLLDAAVALAIEHGAEAIDGFPFISNKRRSSSQIHVGFESTFLDSGFTEIRRPSDSRVVMRRVL